MQSSKIKSFDTTIEECNPTDRPPLVEVQQILGSLAAPPDSPQEQKKKKKKKKGGKNKDKERRKEGKGTANNEDSSTKRNTSLSRSSPSPSRSKDKLTPPPSHGGAWSDADDEILEFVREETPGDRNVGPDPTDVAIATSPLSPSKKKKKKEKQKSGKKNGKKGSRNDLSSPRKADIAENNHTPLDCVEKGDEECRYNEEKEDEPDGVIRDIEALDYEDTDDESGSCSSRFGWQFKNDKLISGRDWNEFYDNMKKHITAGHPRREFAMLDEDALRVYAKRTEDFSCAVAPLNFQKNRYGNILPYNQNRVKLAVAEDQSDYVNASYVKLDDVLPGFQDKVTYIAASAPIPSTVEDFYRMLWETETFGIVMLTRNEEGGRPKCHQYWPEEKEKETYGPFTITNAQEVFYEKLSFLVRRFVLQKGDDAREITHYHYLAWPDHGVPDSSESLEEIIKLINAQIRTMDRAEGRKEPTLVAHCSAGIGRTGAFILIHSLLSLLFQDIQEDDAESLARWASRPPPTVDFVHLVQHMRNQRTCMISQPEQYEFCYHTVLSNLGRALQPAPQRKGDSGLSSPKQLDGLRGGQKKGSQVVQRQKSCILF